MDKREISFVSAVSIVTCTQKYQEFQIPTFSNPQNEFSVCGWYAVHSFISILILGYEISQQDSFVFSIPLKYILQYKI